MRPRDGFSPTSPQHEDGTRIDPPPSEPSASGTNRAATAAAAPPLEPPGVIASFQGFFVGPYIFGSEPMHQPPSGVLVRPSSRNPAALMRRESSLSSGQR